MTGRAAVRTRDVRAVGVLRPPASRPVAAVTLLVICVIAGAGPWRPSRSAEPRAAATSACVVGGLRIAGVRVRQSSVAPTRRCVIDRPTEPARGRLLPREVQPGAYGWPPCRAPDACRLDRS